MKLFYFVAAFMKRRRKRKSIAIIPGQHLIYQLAALVTSPGPFEVQMSDNLQTWAVRNTLSLLRGEA